MKKRKMPKAWKVMTTAAMTSLLFSSLTVSPAEGDVTQAKSQMVEEIEEQGRKLFFDKDKIRDWS